MHNVLAQRGQLAGFRDHVLFQQAVRSGLISNPNLRPPATGSSAEPPIRWHFEISDLWCPSCAEVIRLILLQERGVVNCVVDYFTDLACVEFHLRDLSKERIWQVITSLGYHPVKLDSHEGRRVSLSLWLRFIIASFAALNLMMFAYPIYTTYFTDDPQQYAQLFAWISLGVSIPVVTYSAWPLYRRALTSLWVGILGMEALVALGVLSAFAYSTYDLFRGGIHVYFDSMAVIVAFVLLGKILETRAKFSAKASLLHLAHTLPRRGRVLAADGSESYVPLKELICGDILVALTGEKIVLDGQVVSGEGAVDESLMTGEAVPIAKSTGMSVIAGTLLRQGRLVYRVVATPEQTLLQQLVGMLEKDLGKRSLLVRRVDQIARWFIPLTLALALASGLWAGISEGTLEAGMLRALTVLIIACPCAIGIAVPLAESYLIHGMAALGAIVRNRRCLESLGRETLVIFDKTGTVTYGAFTVCSGLDALTADSQSVLKAMTRCSIHPIACAITQAIPGPWAAVDDVTELPGKGLQGTFQGVRYLLGSRDFLVSSGVHVAVHESTSTNVTFARNLTALTTLELGDRIRPEAAETIRQLSPVRCCLLSGDAVSAVEHVATQCGFDSWRARCSPLDKREFVTDCVQRGEIVVMLGDGINDALALTAAHVGISVVSASDVSVQVSDILLTTDKLTVVPKLCALARRGRQIVQQNLFWAFAYNVVGLGLAAAGLLSPLFAAFAMMASSLIVLVNARRLQRL